MRWFLAVVALALIVVQVATARADLPVSGGRYVDRVRVGEIDVAVDVRLSNDGGEFARLSHVAVDGTCAGSGGLTLSSDSFQHRATPVTPDGGFSYGLSYGSVAGQFIENGQRATGTVTWFGSQSACPPTTIPFQARLVGQPNAPRIGRAVRCDRAFPGPDDTAEVAYLVRARDVGCTTARELARLWHESAECAALSRGSSCSVADGRCQRVRGGLFMVQATVRCPRPEPAGAAVELVRLDACKVPQRLRNAVTLWAINLDCASARRVRFTKGGEPCPGSARARDANGSPGSHARCRRSSRSRATATSVGVPVIGTRSRDSNTSSSPPWPADAPIT